MISDLQAFDGISLTRKIEWYHTLFQSPVALIDRREFLAGPDQLSPIRITCSRKTVDSHAIGYALVVCVMNPAQDPRLVMIFPLADQFVCLEEDKGQIRVLNQVAVDMLDLARGGKSTESIAQVIAQKYDVDLETALSDSMQFIALLDAPDNVPIEEEEHYRPTTDFVAYRTLKAVEHTCLYLPGFRIEVASELYGLSDLLAELFRLSPGNGSDEHTAKLDIYVEGDNFPITADGVTVETGFSLADTAIKCLREVNGLVARSHGRTINFHASAVARDNAAILMPAVGGSGKTSLAAYLMHRGYAYLNDDTVPMLCNSAELLPIPVSLSIKSGSWPVLAAYFPQLQTLRNYGVIEKLYKYLPPADEQVQQLPVPCRLLVVPEYRRAQETVKVERLAAARVFEALINSGCSLGQPVQPEVLASLVSWLDPLPCYKLTYSSLPEVEAVIAELLSQAVSSTV